MSSSATRSQSRTSSYERVNYVVKKVDADLLQAIDHYGHISEDRAADYIHDIRILLDEELLRAVALVWIDPGTGSVMHELRYKVRSGVSHLDDDRPGGVKYASKLQSARFDVRIFGNDRYRDLSATDKKGLGLEINWSPASQLNYRGGSRLQDKTYSQDGYGLERSTYSDRSA